MITARHTYSPTPTDIDITQTIARLNEQKLRRENYLDTKETAKKIVSVSDKVSGTLTDVTTMSASLGAILHTFKIIMNAIPVLRLMGTILSILLNFFKVIMGMTLSFNNNDTVKKITGGYNIAVAIVDISFGLATIPLIALAPFFLSVTFASNALLNIAKLSIATYQIFQGRWSRQRALLKQSKAEFYHLIANTKVPSQQVIFDILDRHRNKALVVDDYSLMGNYPVIERILKLDSQITKSANKVRKYTKEFCNTAHDCMQNIASQIGGVFLMSIPIVGACILGISGVYSILDRYGYNPFKWLGNKIFGNPFKPKEHHATRAEMEAIVNKVVRTRKNNLVAEIKKEIIKPACVNPRFIPSHNVRLDKAMLGEHRRTPALPPTQIKTTKKKMTASDDLVTRKVTTSDTCVNTAYASPGQKRYVDYLQNTGSPIVKRRREQVLMENALRCTVRG